MSLPLGGIVLASTVRKYTVASQVAGDRDSERRQAWRDVFEAHAAIMDLLLTEMKDEVGISFTEYDVLLHLSEMPKPVRMNELAGAVAISMTRDGERVFRDARTVHRRGIKKYFTDQLRDGEVEAIRAAFGRARDA